MINQGKATEATVLRVQNWDYHYTQQQNA